MKKLLILVLTLALLIGSGLHVAQAQEKYGKLVLLPSPGI